MLIKGVKLQRKKKKVFGEFCLSSAIFLVSVLLSASVERCFVSRMRDFFKKIGEQGSSGHHPNNWLFTANHPPPDIGLAAGQVSMEGDWRRLGPFRVGLEGGW